MLKKTLKAILAMVLSVCLMCSFATPAFADEFYYSDTQSRYVNGRTYSFYSAISPSSPTYVFLITKVSASSMAPTGHIGIRCRLYTNIGSISYTSDWLYNSYDLMGLQYNDSCTAISNKYYYSQGTVQFYTGQGYSTFESYPTPNIQILSDEIDVTVNVNQNGEIYGSELLLNKMGIQPDLLEAVGDNDVIGYVKNADLNDRLPTNPEEAVVYSSMHRNNRTIPLYESDGETVIGTFTIMNENASITACE